MEGSTKILKVKDWFHLSEIDFYVNHHTSMKDAYDLNKVKSRGSEHIENFYTAVKSWYEEDLRNNSPKIIHD